MNRQTLTASILLLGASLLTGCDGQPPAQSAAEFRAQDNLGTAIHTACLDFEKGMSGAYDLPKAPGTPKFASYGGLLETYLLAAADQDEPATVAALEGIHEVLRVASAREFVMFYRALAGSVLAEAVDAKGEPVLRPIDEAALPLVLLLHHMGARKIDSELAVWLFLRGDAVSASWSKSSAFSTAGVFVDHGDGLLRLSVADQAKVVDSITAGTFLSGCGLDELQTPVGDLPLCPAQCEFEVAKLGLEETDAAALQTWCDVMGGELLPDLNPDTADVMLACLDAYEEAIGRTDLAVCLVESFASLSDDPFPSYEGTTRVRMGKECMLSTDAEDAAQGVGIHAATGSAAAKTLAGLKARRDTLQDVINKLDDVVIFAPGKVGGIVAPVIEGIINKLQEERNETTEEIEDIENGDTGSKRCAMDAQACTTGCDVKSAVQQATEACIQSTSTKVPLKSPDPIDPPQPIVDPDSPIGVLTSCLADAAVSDEDTGACGMNITCLDGKQAELIDGVCMCSAERSVLPPELGCDETIQCLDEPCTCEGAPMTGDGGRPPEPDPFLLFEFRG